MIPFIVLIVPVWHSGKERENYRVPVSSIRCYYPDPGALPECKDRTIMELEGGKTLTIPRPIDKIDWVIQSCWATPDNIAFVKVI